MSRRKQAKPRSLIVTPEDEMNTEEVATDHPTQSPEDLLPPCQVISNHAQQERDSLKLEPASTEMEPVDRCSDINVVSSDHPLGGAQLPGGVFHCEVCSREFGSLSRFMDHRNEGCVSSENESDHSTGSQPCQSSPMSTSSPSHPNWCCPLSPGGTPTDPTPFSLGLTDDYPYPCQFCEKAFAKVDHLKQHEQNSHSEKMSHRCDVCSRQFRHKRSRDRHIKLHTGDRKYRCPHCRTAFSRSDHLKMHLKTHVSTLSADADKHQHVIGDVACRQCSPGGSTRCISQVFSCGQCFQSFLEVSEMDSHVCVQRTSPERVISGCSKTEELSDSSNADRKLSDKEEDGILAGARCCPFCTMCFHDVEHFYAHLASHELDEKVSIKLDRDGHKDVAVVDSRVYNKGSPHSDGPSQTCVFCKLDFDQADLLKTHMQLMHTGKSDHLFSCQFCELAFSSMHWLSEHVSDCHRDLVVTHGSVTQRSSLSPCCHLTGTPGSNSSAANVVFCSQCSVGFPDIYALGQHIQHVHGFSTSSSRETSPPVQKKRLGSQASSASKESLTFHPYKDAKKKKNPTGGQQSCVELSYVCDYCNAVFASASSYQTHLKFHDRETSVASGSAPTPYMCNECDATFTQEDELKSHTFTHYLVVATEYGCTSCLKLFTKPDELQKHLMDIHAHHLYRCSLCKEVFDSKVNIQVHFAIKHSNECKLFRCARCRSVFRSEMEWHLHVKVHHLGISDPYRCYLCKDSFSVEAELEAHIAASHKKQFVCPICDDEAFHVEYLLDKHMQQKHSVDASSPKSPQFLKVTSGVSSAVSVSRESPTAETLRLMTSGRRSVPELMSPKMSQLYKCEICDLKFAEEMALQCHHMNSHNITCDKDLGVALKPETPPLKTPNHSHENHHMMGRSWSSAAGSNDRASHQCVRCNKTLKTRMELDKHMKMHHHVQQQQPQQHHATGNSSHKCNICDEIFASANILAAHKLTHCKVAQGNVCVVCRVAITCEDQFYSHTQQHSVHTANMQCVVCRQTLVSMLELQMHGKHHFQTSAVTPPAQLYTCCLCLKTFDTKENLISKLNSSGVEYHICKPCFHGETPTTLTLPAMTPQTEHGRCVTCGVKFETDAQLKAHMTQHQKTYQCIKCQQTFASEYDIQIHVATHVMHEGNIHQCHLCDTLCESPAKLQCHLIQHTFNNSDMTCSICSATFSQASAIQLHVLEHGIGVRPYSCSECQQKFFFSAELQNHLYSHQLPRQPPPGKGQLSTQNIPKKTAINTDHQGDADILCSVCPKMFSSVADMQHHYLVEHSNIEPVKPKIESLVQQQPEKLTTNAEVSFTKTGKMHSCPECHKEFDMAKHLTIHLRSYHNIGKPFDCSICGKRFSRKDNCKAHMKCHQGALRCPVCDKTFQRQMVLEEHMTSHFKQPPTSAGTYTCELCGEMFAHSNYLQSHLATAHERQSAASNPECQVCSAVFTSVTQLKDHLQNDHGKADLTDLLSPVKNGSPSLGSNGNCDDYIGTNGQLLKEVKMEQMDTKNTDLVTVPASSMNGQTEQLTVM